MKFRPLGEDSEIAKEVKKFSGLIREVIQLNYNDELPRDIMLTTFLAIIKNILLSEGINSADFFREISLKEERLQKSLE